MASAGDRPILYHYSFSPYARRVVWYLNLRGIPYAEVKQPPIMPRPDLTKIGVNYRRIPLMAIGKDVYCDTRIILAKLEELYPDGALGALDPDQKALQKLLEIWKIEAGVFARGAQLIPSDSPLMKDPKFTKDREQFNGRAWSKEKVDEHRPEALVSIRSGFSFLETTLLADGRDWLLKSDKPTLADIEGVWVFHWLNGLKGSLPKDLISEASYPKVFAWIKRFDNAVKAAKAAAPNPVTLRGDDAARQILTANHLDSNTTVDKTDPLGLQEGTEVEVFPIDSGFSHKDSGRLMILNEDEVAIQLQNGIRLHFPRTGFRIKELNDKQARL